MAEIKNSLEQLEHAIVHALNSAQTEQELETVRLKYLTRASELTLLLASLKNMSPDDKRLYGPLFNQARQRVHELYESTKNNLQEAHKQAEQQKRELFDVTAYTPHEPHGTLHPYTHVIQKIENTIISMGYAIVDGPELESEEINFDALNIPAHHPARDLQDTLWLTLPHMLMRTHTSNVQIRIMRTTKPPIAIMSSGRTYRYEATDASHDYVFMQTELMLIDKKASLSNLFATIQEFCAGIFDRHDLKIKIQPTYYPFVEPGAEAHMQCVFCTNGCSVCKQSGWIEIGGLGLVHPNVLRACNLDPEEYQGFAFGFGLTRLVMLKYGINDIRLLSSGNLEFLKQF